jgi:hypothetical protein
MLYYSIRFGGRPLTAEESTEAATLVRSLTDRLAPAVQQRPGSPHARR